MLVAGVPPARAATPEPAADPAADYNRCLQLAHDDPRKALERATDWRDAGGGFPAEHCAAVALIGLKQYEGAARRLEALGGAMMDADPGLRAGALEQAGQAWLLADRPASAKTAFDAALKFKPDDPELLIDRAEAYAAAGRFLEAIDDLDRVLQISPQRADALIYRASAYRRINRLDQALDDVERALKQEPDAVPGLLERGNIRRLKGDIAGARSDWQRVGGLAPGSPAALAAEENLAQLGEIRSPADQLITAPPQPK